MPKKFNKKNIIDKCKNFITFIRLKTFYELKTYSKRENSRDKNQLSI